MWTKLFFAFALYFSSLGQPIFAGWMSFWPFSQCVQALRRTAPPAQVAAMDTSPQDSSYSLQIRIPEFLNDQRFRVQMFEAVLGWVKEIKERREKNIPSPSLQEILVSLGATRRQIAYEMSTPHAGVFGLEGSWTNDVWRTIVSESDNLYSSYYERISTKVSKETSNQSRGKYFVVSSRGIGMEYLRRVIHIRATSRTRVGRRMNGQDYQLALLQPRFLMTRPALAYLSDAFEALLNEQTLKRKEIFERLPEIHWLLSHIMPFQRGSASITDALTKIILLEKGQPLYLWKEGITPDPEAFLTDFEVYQKAYTSFFEANPLSLPSED